MQILFYLLKNKKTTYGELAQLFEVSNKTIERDINALSGAGVPVHCQQGSGGGVYIDSNYTLSKSFFTKEDLHNIIFALNTFDSISKKSRKDEILQKLCLISPELTALFDEDARDYFVVDLIEDKPYVNPKVEENINKCMDEWLQLILNVENQEFQVSPISYVLKPKGVYLYCFDTEYRLIPLGEIIDSRVTNIKFKREFIPYRTNNQIK